jgi:hypothetical protein
MRPGRIVGKPQVSAGVRAGTIRRSATVYHGSCWSLRRMVAAHLLPAAEANLRDHHLLGSTSVPPAAPPVAVSSIPDSRPNRSSIAYLGGDLARPGLGPADRGTTAAVRGAARRQLGYHSGGGRQRRALHLRRRHQGLEPDAAGAPAPARAVPPPARRLPRPPTKAAVAPTAKHRPTRMGTSKNRGGPRQHPELT